jgi:hypothetical protein
MAIEVCPACGPQEFEQAPDGQAVTFCTICNCTRAKAQERVDDGLAGPGASRVKQAFVIATIRGTVDTRHLTDDELIELSLLLAPLALDCPYTPAEAARCKAILACRAEAPSLSNTKPPWLALAVVGVATWAGVRLVFGYTVATSVAVFFFLLFVVYPWLARLSSPRPQPQ